MRRVSLALLLATAGIPALASPAQAGPLQEVLARAAPDAQTAEYAQRGDYRAQHRRDRHRAEHRRERREWRHDRRDDHHDRRDDHHDRWEAGYDRRDDHRDAHRDYRRDHRDLHRDNPTRRQHNYYHREAQRDHRDYHGWNRSWRNDRRYDWRDYRHRYGSVYRPSRHYYAPYRGHRYSRPNVGLYFGSGFYGSNYWISDPWRYRLPPAHGSLRWVRYYNDVMLIDLRDGYVVDVIYDFFW